MKRLIKTDVSHRSALRKNMSRVALAIFVCVVFSALVNAGQRKIADPRGEKIFVADPGRPRIQRKLRRATGQRFRRTAHASRLTPKATRRIALVLSVTLQSPTSPAAKSRLYQIFRATIVSVLSGRRMENNSLFQL